MKRLSLSLCMAVLFGLPGAAAADGLRDVLIVERDGPHVWLAMDATPAMLESHAEPGRLILDLPGYTLAESRRIIPARAGWLSLIEATPGEGGARLVVEGDFTSAEASLRQGGVWIVLDPAGSAGFEDASGQPGSGTADTPTATDGLEAEARLAAAPASTLSDPAAGFDDASPGAADASSPALEAGQGASASTGATAPAPAQPGEDGDGLGPDADQAPEAEIAADPDAPGPCDATAAAVQQSPWDLDALTRHADCLVELGARENAAGLYERVLAFDPSHFRAAIGLARIREAQGRQDEAAALYQRAADAALTDGEALAARQAAARSNGDD
jgi:tetratricopeptide (TPR) repeat protein